MSTSTIPVSIDDPINARILAVSEDQISGFMLDPIEQIAARASLDLPTVIERISAMMGAGTIRRVRQTLLATNLAHGALVAWRGPVEQLNTIFDDMFANDPFTGHVVIRTTDPGADGATYRLWTTVKVPQGYSLKKHCDYLVKRTGAMGYRAMPAKKVFSLGVGHVRRRGLEPGARSDEPGQVIDTQTVVSITEEEWRVLTALKREFEPREIGANIWAARAAALGMELDVFARVARSLDDRGVIGRFSTFLEHVKKHADGKSVTRYNALFHWAVPAGREVDAGREVGRHHVMTHAYWREGGAEFNHVNVMGVAHGMEQDLVLEHKAAIDAHLTEAGIAVSYTNVFWGGRSEIKPSEISPIVYREWCAANGVDAETMR
ncbi:MAG: AsnC family transcriptional regulator [Planctomycetaceae bacterium]|nr:AsnC family transcriptional regulator [Planctomycetaceae bacterium]